MSPTEPIPPSVPPPPGEFPPPPPPGSSPPPPPPPGADAGSKSHLGLWIALAVIVLVILIAFVVFIFKKNQDEPTPTSTPAGSTSASPSASTSHAESLAGFSGDSALNSATIPARGGELHGCLASPVTLASGTGKGSGVVGNGSATPVTVVSVGEPLVGHFTAGGPQLKIYALYCYANDQKPGDGVMIDMAVLNEAGQLLPMVPASIWDAVTAKTPGSEGEIFPLYDTASLKLASADALVTYGGSTVASQPTTEFTVSPAMSPTSNTIQLTVTVV